MRRNVLNSPQLSLLKNKRRRASVSKILFFIFGLLAVFALLIYLSRINSLNISEIKILGNKTIDTETLKATTQAQISGKYLWLFPKSNILYYPQSAIKKDLQSKFLRIKDINLSIENNKVLVVSLTERIPKYTWCGVLRSPADSSPEKCYFLDESGYIFDEAPYFSGDVYFKFYGTAGVNVDNPSGSRFSVKNFPQLISFKDVLVGLGLKTAAIGVKDEGDVEIYLMKTASSITEPKILLKADANIQNITENLQSALDTEPLKSNFKNKYSTLQYIDLRFGNKVYYKF